MIICCVEDQIPTQEILEQIILEQFKNASINMFSNTKDALSFLETNNVNLIITDIDIHGRKKLDVVKYANTHNFPVIVYSAHDEQWFINAAFKEGATVFISKFERLDTLRNAIKSWRHLSSSYGSHLPIERNYTFQKLQLSDKDKDLLRLLIKGETREMIGKKLHLSTNSVNSYLRDLCSKYDCKKEELIHRFLMWDTL